MDLLAGPADIVPEDRLRADKEDLRLITSGSRISFSRLPNASGWNPSPGSCVRGEVLSFLAAVCSYPDSSTMISTSTGAFMGSSATPTAVRAWSPFSPKSSPIKSEAPFITSGWSLKPAAEAT
jgi:hypothetical protein